MKTKRGQMKISFGMIFSIILIIIFLIIAFYAIQKFLDLQQNVQVNQFADSLKSDVDKMWRGSQGSQEFTYSLPSKTKSVCFAEDDFENLVVKDNEGASLLRTTINHIDIKKILDGSDKFCLEIKKGKVSIILKKEYGQTLVNVIQN